MTWNVPLSARTSLTDLLVSLLSPLSAPPGRWRKTWKCCGRQQPGRTNRWEALSLRTSTAASPRTGLLRLQRLRQSAPGPSSSPLIRALGSWGGPALNVTQITRIIPWKRDTSMDWISIARCLLMKARWAVWLTKLVSVVSMSAYQHLPDQLCFANKTGKLATFSVPN